MLSEIRPSFEVAKEGRILNFVSGYRRFEFAEIVYNEKSFGSESILAFGLLFDLYLSLS
jgi:hypothetical protein